MLRICQHCKEEKELEKFVKSEVYKGTQYYRHKCKECFNATLRTGKSNTGRFQKGNNNWIGRKHTEETKSKISELQKGKKQKPETIEKRRQKHLGKRRKQTRHASRKYQEWRNLVKEKDKWKCKHCECEDKKILHAHHIQSWKSNESLRFDVNNGMTLCKYCHAKEETKNRIGQSFSKETEFKKGHIPWNKGIKK
jgi:hypothetical protein